MPKFVAKIVSGEVEVEQRLAVYGLAPDQFLAVADVARLWANDASPLMPMNAPGTLAYIFGVNELRMQLLDEHWHIDRLCGVETVINREIGVRIGFQNVDKACDVDFAPMPRSTKGSASELLNGPTLFERMGVETGPLTGVSEDGIPTFYVMVGEDGSVELSQPVISGGAFKAFIERIFIRGDNPDWEDVIDEESGPVDNFDIPVRFRA